MEWGSFPDESGRRDGSGHREMVVDFPTNVVAGARRTPGRLKTGGVPPKPPATIFISLWPSVFLGLRIVVQDVAASFSDALSRQPSYSSSSLRPLPRATVNVTALRRHDRANPLWDGSGVQLARRGASGLMKIG